MLIEILKAVLFGIVEGITEWLPISSTGHMILVDQFVHLNVSADFYKMFEVVIQLGAIMAVVVLFWNKLWPFHMKNEKPAWKDGALSMWLKIIVAVIPAAIIGVLFDDKIDELFYHPVPVAIALIVVGVLFIVVETIMKGKKPSIRNIGQITYKAAVIIGLFLMFFTKILMFYKWIKLFFDKISSLFLLILYFCALEIMPYLLLYQGLRELNNILVIKI